MVSVTRSAAPSPRALLPGAARYLPWLALLASVALTVWVWHQIRTDIQATARLRFEHRAENAAESIRRRMAEYEQLLRALAVDINPVRMTPASWRKRFEVLRPLETYPGIQNVGYAPRLSESTKDAFVASVRAQGMIDYDIRPEGRREAYVPVAYTEPITLRTQRAFGFDMYSQPTRRKALDEARDSGTPTTSALVTLVTEGSRGQQPGILMYLAVYAGGNVPDSVAKRRASIQGYIYGAFRTYDLLEGILGKSQRDLHIAVFDGSSLAAKQLLYANSEAWETGSDDTHSALESLQSIAVGGQTWTLWLRATPSFQATADRMTPNLVLAGGIALALLIAGILRAMAGQRTKANALVQLSEELSRSVKSLQGRNDQLNLLREMSDVMQSATSVQEGAGIAARFIERLAGNLPGGLFLIDNSRTALRSEMVWGDIPEHQRSFGPEDCWALRRSKPVFADGDNEIVRCNHVDAATAHAYLCVPMAANGEILGVLHLREHASEAHSGLARSRDLLELIGEQVGVALGSLRLRENLRQQSIRDPLTGLFNRRYLEETLGRETHRAARERGTVAILMLDVDHFKRLNDTFGHEAGDQVLRELGRLLPRYTRKSDIACRFGGEEFVVVLPGAPYAIAEARAEQIRAGVESLTLKTSGAAALGPVTVSIGVALSPDDGPDWPEALAQADRALYQAKATGRNRVVLAHAMGAPISAAPASALQQPAVAG